MTAREDERKSRLAFDYKVVNAMAQTSSLIDVRAFGSQHDLTKCCRPVRNALQGSNAVYYLVHYRVKSPVGPGEFYTGFDVVFDLLSKKTYPEERADHGIDVGGISATCVSKPMPWSPHFLGSNGTICLGSIWRGTKHTLLAHVIIHVARLLNWDEPIGAHYGGWNPAAVAWWKKHMNAKPITPGLRYPTPPAELTHGRRTSSSEAGQSVSAAGKPSRSFQIIGVGNSPTRTSGFKIRSTGKINI